MKILKFEDGISGKNISLEFERKEENKNEKDIALLEDAIYSLICAHSIYKDNSDKSLKNTIDTVKVLNRVGSSIGKLKDFEKKIENLLNTNVKENYERKNSEKQ